VRSILKGVPDLPLSRARAFVADAATPERSSDADVPVEMGLSVIHVGSAPGAIVKSSSEWRKIQLQHNMVT